MHCSWLHVSEKYGYGNIAGHTLWSGPGPGPRPLEKADPVPKFIVWVSSSRVLISNMTTFFNPLMPSGNKKFTQAFSRRLV